MKRFSILVGLAAAAIIFTGCGGGGGGGGYVPDPGPGPGPGPGPEYVTLFLIDSLGYGIEYVPYVCFGPGGEIVADDVTFANGEFSFIPGDRCEFDLYGFDGSFTMPIFIADDLGYGKFDIPYDCDNGVEFANGVTDYDGYFEYPIDAFCKFYL